MPPGDKSYMGQAPALYGESEIVQQASGADVLTITGHSSMASDFLVLRTNVTLGSTRGDTEKFVVGSSGEVRTQQQLVATFSTTVLGNSTVPPLSATRSGQTIYVAGFSSGVTLTLPAAAAGLCYNIVVGPGNASVVTVSATAGGDIIRPPGASGGTSAQALEAVSTRVSRLKLTAINATSWLAEENLHISSAWTSGNDHLGDIGGRWVIGSTIA